MPLSWGVQKIRVSDGDVVKVKVSARELTRVMVKAEGLTKYGARPEYWKPMRIRARAKFFSVLARLLIRP